MESFYFKFISSIKKQNSIFEFNCRENMKKNHKLHLTLISYIVLSFSSTGFAQITWPASQLLPSFPTTASSQDLIYLNGSVTPYSKTWTWQAEGVNLSHLTGAIETDGWLCKVGTDAANEFMINGAIDSTVTMGPNVAEFRMKVDNITLDDNPIVDIDVRHIATGNILATQTITRKQFTTAGSYTNFKLNFMMPVDSQAIELRVKWRGTAYTKVDWISISQNNSSAEIYLFASMKGIVNKTKPRIFSYDGDAFAEGAYTWMQSLGLSWTENTNNWTVLNKYRKEISGIIIYDPTQIHTVNLASMMAKDKNAIIASPSLISKLTSSPFYYPILADLRGQFSSKMEVYQELYDKYWPSIDKRLLIGLNPEVHKGSLREYAVALGAAVIWLNPDVAVESTLLNRFLSSMPEGSNYMGWWPEEQPGVTRGSIYGIPTIASDFCSNLTIHSGMPRKINIKPMPAKPALQNKIYVAFILSDGDNLQYVEHLMRKLWSNADRGSVPIGWTLSPAMVDAMPGALNYYHSSSTVNDNLISGPSGYGYTYPNYWSKVSLLNQFVSKTEEYNNLAGFRVVTIWNTITGGISAGVGQAFASYAPTLLGMTAQNTGGALSIYKLSLPGMPLSCNYCSGEQAMIDHINSASAGWTKTKPKFVIIQAAPWNNVTPTSFKNVKNTLGSDYVVVRPDHLFQLMREANNLTINPGAVNGNGQGLKGTYYNGKNFETEVGNRIDAELNFNWNTESPFNGVDVDAFSVRWTGTIQPRYSGTYTFYTTCDNGSRLWINNQLIIDKWANNTGTTYTGVITLTAGEKYDIKMEYFDNTGKANCMLEWASGLQSREVVPQSQLYNEISAVNETNFNNKVSISPNPIENGIMNISLNDFSTTNAQIKIFDLCGKSLLKTKITESGQINVSQLQKGTYIVSVELLNGIANKKIVIQ